MKHTTSLLLSSVSFLVLAGASVQAQEVFDMGEIIVSANQTPTQTNRSGAVVETIDAETLQQGGTTRVADALDALPGVSLSGNGGVGSSASLRIRGLPSRYVSVFIDGVDVSDPSGTQTQFNFGTLLNTGLSQVEVLKGSQSAIYGSEAVGGVVSITSLRATEPGTVYRFSAEVGSYNTIATSFAVATKTERGEVALTLSHYNTDGFSARDENDGNTEDDGYQSNQVILSAAYDATDTVRLGFTATVQDANLDIDGFFGDADRPFLTDRRSGRIFAEIDGAAVDHTIAYTYNFTRRADPTANPTFNTLVFEGLRQGLDYKGVTNIGGTTLAFGAAYVDESSDADGVEADNTISSVFAEAQFALSQDTDLSLSARYDDHSEFGSFNSLRAAFVHRLNNNTRVRASLGNGFRAPSLFELFSGDFGNTDLQPEESWSAEVGIEHDYASGAFVKATLYYTEIDNLIDFVTLTSFPAPFTGEYQQSEGTTRSRGIEVSGAMPLSDQTEVFGSYTYTNTTDASGNQLVRVPEHDLNLGLKTSFAQDWSAGLSVQHIAGRADDGGQVMDDYTVVNATVSYDLSDSTELYARIDNLTNREYQTSAGFGTSDRAIFVGVRASF